MLKRLILLAALLSFLVIILGAYVRLSDAGLGCPDWPGCYGKAIVSESDGFKQQAQTHFPDNPLETAKAWKEMTHRYLAGALSIVALALAVLAWREKSVRWLGVGLLLLIAMQAVLGMWTVALKVMPLIVTSHLLLGFATFVWIGLIYLRTLPSHVSRQVVVISPWLVGSASILVFLQIALGGWVSSNHAALACSDFPRCQGQWLPAADFAGGFDLFKDLIAGQHVELSHAAKLAIHWAHRVGALLVFIICSVLMMQATSEENPKPLRRSGLLLSIVLFVQIMLGIFNIKYMLPIAVAIAHNAVAAILLLVLLAIHFFNRYGVGTEEQPEQVSSQAEEIAAVSTEELDQTSLYLRLKNQLQRTRNGLGGVLSVLNFNQKALTQELLDQIEASLLMADLGIETTQEIIRHLTSTLDREQLQDGDTLRQVLKQHLYDLLLPCSQPLQITKQEGPYVILVVGVNGAGKTTSIGKLAHRLQMQGHSVMLAAGDTFRAAAVEQLQTWGERNNVHVVAQHTGADSASVIFDGLESAKAKGIDVLIADTAGRLHTKSNLMDELKKIKRIMGKLDDKAPHEVLLVLDAGTGQNALSQARQFNEAVSLTGIALTKLDGTAKGGVIFALANQLRVPIRFIGVGEGIADLQDFDAKTFVDALFVNE